MRGNQKARTQNRPRLQEERIQKYLANQGVASRRAIERMIEHGEIFVDGAPAVIGMKVTHRNRIEVRGRDIDPLVEAAPRILLYHKAIGEICSRASDGHATVFERLPRLDVGRWIAMGRLDVNSSGLLCFTNHGVLAHKAMHPSSELERTYWARVRGLIEDPQIELLKKGAWVEGEHLRFDDVRLFKPEDNDGKNRFIQVSLHTGRYREVRRLFEEASIQVSRLKRISFAGVKIPFRLKPSRFEEADESLVRSFFRYLEVPFPRV